VKKREREKARKRERERESDLSDRKLCEHHWGGERERKESERERAGGGERVI